MWNHQILKAGFLFCQPYIPVPCVLIYVGKLLCGCPIPNFCLTCPVCTWQHWMNTLNRDVKSWVRSRIVWSFSRWFFATCVHLLWHSLDAVSLSCQVRQHCCLIIPFLLCTKSMCLILLLWISPSNMDFFLFFSPCKLWVAPLSSKPFHDQQDW